MATGGVVALSQYAPFRITPIFMPRVWGLRDLRPWYDRTTEVEPIGEVWLTGDNCVAETGPHVGKKLGDIFAEIPKAMLGGNAPQMASPLLIKVIFAKEKLSVQVHPDDSMAQKYGEPRGKTECWYVLSAEVEAQVACGLQPDATLDGIKSGIEKGTLEANLNILDVHTGDMIYIDAGTVHAIWPGLVLLETQQNCDLTYRMYDYGRPRELHIEKSLEAIRFITSAGKVTPQSLSDRTVLIDTDYFCVERIVVSGSRTSQSLQREAKTVAGLSYLFASSGTATIRGEGFADVVLPAHSIAAVPAASPAFVIQDNGSLDLIRITPSRE